MATPVNIVTAKNSWNIGNVKTKLFESTSSLSAEGAYSDNPTAWTTQDSGSVTTLLVVTPGVDLNVMSWKFYGTDAADEVFLARFWGFTDISVTQATDYVGDYICDATVTLGSKGINNSSTVLPPGKLWAKRLDVTVDSSLFPGVRVIGQAGNAAATLLFDGLGYDSYILELRMQAPPSSGLTAALAGGTIWRAL